MKKTVAFKRDVVNVFFHILTACNLKCKHCYVDPKHHGRNSLPLAVIEKWLSIFSSRYKNPNIVFLGGEPTMHEELPQAIKKARNLGYSSITVDTNGYLFNQILEKVTPEEVDYFSFSLDGASSKTNDRIRGKGSYDRCISGIRQTIKKKFSVSLIYTVSSANIHELSKMESLLKKLKADRFFIQVIGLRGKSAKAVKEIGQVKRSQWINIVPDIADKIARQGIIVTYPKVYLEVEETFECAAEVAKNFFIFPNGRVYQCPVCEDFPIHSMEIIENRLVRTKSINENDLFKLEIPEGCVMNRLIQSDNIDYGRNGLPKYKIACCLLKEEIRY